MSTIGEYQNNIKTLPKLDLEQYERIFKVFEESNNGKKFQFYNILKKIDIPDNLNSDFVDFYTPQSAMPFTIISHNIYGDQRLWWLIFLINKDTIGSDIFVMPAGKELKFIKPQYLGTVFGQITNLVIYNGRHF